MKALGWMLPILGWLMGPVWAGGPEKFAGEVDGLVQRGQPAPGHVLLVGSSTMRLWKTAAADLAPLPIENRGFGGSHTEDQLFYFDRLMAGLEPAVVVWYCGSNDVNAGKEPERIYGKPGSGWTSSARSIRPYRWCW